MIKRILLLIAFLSVSTLNAGCERQPVEYLSTYATPTTIVGDSYTGGSPSGGRGEHGWPHLVSEILRTNGTPIDVRLATESGSGYVNDGIHEGKIFEDQILSSISKDTGLVVIAGSPNDQGIESGVLATAVRQALSDARAAAAPGARIIVIGPAWVTLTPDPRIFRVRDVVQSEAALAGARFVDPLADRWFDGAPEWIGANGDHPSDAGHALMADKIAPIIAEELLKSSFR